MDDQRATAPSNGNQDVSRTTLTYVMLHPTALDPSAMSAVDVANHMEGGEFIGRVESIVTAPVPAADVPGVVAEMGGIEGFFADRAPADEAEV